MVSAAANINKNSSLHWPPLLHVRMVLFVLARFQTKVLTCGSKDPVGHGPEIEGRSNGDATI